MELFQQQGYDATTTAEIAARAGVTERTFFRHFADKREALFDGEEAFRDILREAVAAAPQDMSPLEALFHAFRSVEPLLQRNRPFTEPRQKVIADTPALQERVLTKIANLTVGLSNALLKRGVEEGTAAFAAQIGMATFAHATRAWLADPTTDLSAHLAKSHAELRRLST
ncbi:TetR/AcrR family transcriptional regulator [Lichenifustis flavocetrariae]|uniref:TetR/AcrR family transcriptional regulator n=1 Tax=Lichenifustis flavocetrariae TaxID=2949735 RepID=A0AA41Z2U1_9HYPH|nr:helix-turn-helix domain-containing protein [Lichenifustis flavocetrariae]MCW6513191.1 TetR/AcrR family transcriptional regulator [Lichenifustis flavocetrariae]